MTEIKAIPNDKKPSPHPLLDYIYSDDMDTENFEEWLDDREPTEKLAKEYLDEDYEDPYDIYGG